jgi:DNA-binding response OmpR family regulator
MAIPGTILIVDDDPLIVELLSESLGDEGYTVQVAYTGEAALAAMRAEPPDLLLLDFRLPGMNGLAVVQAARAQGLDMLPIVLMTADDPMQVRQQIGAVDGYMFKPFDIQELIDCVARCLRVGRTSETPTTDDGMEAAV